MFNWGRVLILGWLILVSTGASTQAQSIERPFSAQSIWNRLIPENASYYDVYDAIWGKARLAPNRVSIELVTLLYVDESQPETRIVQSRGWNYPARSLPSGLVFYTRRLAPDAGVEMRFPRIGNASYVIIDSARSTADEGSAGWRDPGGDLLGFFDEPRLHNINLRGAGESGTLGSGLPALGGLIRRGELNSGINHALSISMGSRRFSRSVHFTAPAWRADGFAGSRIQGYFGNNPHYTLGSLLAIPPSVDINQINWNTPQGRVLAQANQRYGWYIVDSSDGGLGGDIMKLTMSRDALAPDLGLAVDPETNNLVPLANVIDVVGMEADIRQIMRLVMATTK